MTSKRNTSIKSKERVRKFGEVFTPSWLVKDMCNLLPDEIAKLDSRILEPACGEGVFFIEILTRKLANVKTNLDVLVAVSSLYGIDIQADNIEICKKKLFDMACDNFRICPSEKEKNALTFILNSNIVVNNFLTMDINLFKEWNVADIERLIQQENVDSVKGEIKTNPELL